MSKPRTIREVVEQPEESEQGEHNAFVNALLEGRYRIAYDPEHKPDISPQTWSKLHREAKWWRGGYEDTDIPAPNATREKIVLFFKWFRRTYPQASLPESHEAISRQWANFELENIKSASDSKPRSSASLDWRDREYPSVEEVFAADPTMLAQIEERARRFEERNRKPSDRRRQDATAD